MDSKNTFNTPSKKKSTDSRFFMRADEKRKYFVLPRRPIKNNLHFIFGSDKCVKKNCAQMQEMSLFKNTGRR